MGGSGAVRLHGDTEVHLVARVNDQLVCPSLPAERLSELQKQSPFQGKSKQVVFIRFGGKELSNALYVGIGDLKEWSDEKARVAGALVSSRLQTEKSVHATILSQTLTPKNLAAFVEGLCLAAYQFKKYHTTKNEPISLTKVTVQVSDRPTHESVADLLKRVEASVECTFLARDWSNEPSNIGTPTYFADQAVKVGRAAGLKVRVLGEKECRAEKMELFLAVGRGSPQENKMVVVEYAPKQAKGAKTIAFVGKGVTFDTGGISIKPSSKMEDMKHDMSGAATMFAACLLASKWKVPNKIVGVMVFTENTPSGEAIHPGAVIKGRAGKTVEIVNTDAEGRLILADALDYAQDFKPNVVVDAATLTGAIAVALGRYAAGLFSNSDTVQDQLERAAQIQSERVWPMPMYDEYFEDMKSEYADMKNIAYEPGGGSSRGAIFLKQFIRDKMPWAHLDIAATAWDCGYLPYQPKRGGTGAHVRTLAQFAEDYQ